MAFESEMWDFLVFLDFNKFRLVWVYPTFLFSVYLLPSKSLALEHYLFSWNIKWYWDGMYIFWVIITHEEFRNLHRIFFLEYNTFFPQFISLRKGLLFENLSLNQIYRNLSEPACWYHPFPISFYKGVNGNWINSLP